MKENNNNKVKENDSFWDQFEYRETRKIVQELITYGQLMMEQVKLQSAGIDAELSDYPLTSSEGKVYFWDVLRVRPCLENDLPGVMELDREAFSDHWSLESWQRELKMETPKAVWIVAEVQGHIAGFGGFWLAAGEAQLMKIAVRKEIRNRGLGEFLLDFLVGESLMNGAEAMTLEVREHNVAAQKMYERYGFVFQGIRPDYYSDPHEGAVLMRLGFSEDDLAEEMKFKGSNTVIPIT